MPLLPPTLPIYYAAAADGCCCHYAIVYERH
jgi:hypothetical protein